MTESTDNTSTGSWRFSMFDGQDDDGTPPLLQVDPADPWKDVPLLLRLICGAPDLESELGNLAPKIRSVLRDPTHKFDSIYEKLEGLEQLIDDLRYAAVRDRSAAIGDVADRALWRWSIEAPRPELLKRLEVRLREVAGPIHASRRTVLGRAVELAHHRLELLEVLFAERLRPRRLLAGGDAFETVLQPLKELLEGSSASLPREIDAAIAQLKIDRDMEAAIASPDVPEGGVPVKNPADAGGDEDDDNETVEDEDLDEPREQVLVLPRLPSGSSRDQKSLLAHFKDIAGELLPLVPTPDLVPVRQRLRAQLPHLAPVIDQLLQSLSGRRSVGLPPTLLVGPPGCGKTTLAEELCQLLGVPNVTIDAAGVADAMLLGSSRKWTNAAPGVPLSMVLEHRIGNPAIVIDELEKLGGSDHNGDLRLMLLGALEPRRARRFLDRHLEVETDISHVVWLATANSLEGLSPPLRNRMRVFKCPLPGPQHLAALAPQLLAAHYEKQGLDPRWATPLSGEELEVLASYWRGGSLRDLARYIAGIVTVREQTLGCA